MSETSNSAELEIELSYLLTRVPDGLDQIQPTRIVDVYLSDDSDLTTKLRLRQKDDKYEFTKKVNLDPNDLSMQHEYNVPLTKREFELLRGAGGREVIKDRYLLDAGGHTIEIDVFRGALGGFALAEVEFKSQAERAAFTPPDYCGADITQENFIAGAHLAGKSLSDIQPHLDRLGYKPLKIK